MAEERFRTIILDIIRATGTDGSRVDDVAARIGCPIKQTTWLIQDYRRRGLLFSGGKPMAYRWFTDKAHADAHTAAVRAAGIAATRERHKAKKDAFRATLHRIDAELKASGGQWVGYDPRYQVRPGADVFGAGFAACGVGRDVETGRAWG